MRGFGLAIASLAIAALILLASTMTKREDDQSDLAGDLGMRWLRTIGGKKGSRKWKGSRQWNGDYEESPQWKVFGQFRVGDRAWERVVASSISKDGKCVAIAGKYRSLLKVDIQRVSSNGILSPVGNSIYPKNKDGNGKGMWGIDNGGISLSANCDYIVLGIPTTVTGDKFGAVRVYKYLEDENSWKPVGRDLLGGRRFEDFGERVSISDNGQRVATCGEDYEKGRGRCRVLEWTGEEWEQIGPAIKGGAKGIKNLGDTLRLSGSGDVFATQGQDDDKNGHVFVFKLRGYGGPTPKWVLRDGISRDGEEGLFGYSLSINENGDFLAIGAPAFDRFSKIQGQQDDAGRVRMFKWDTSSSSYRILGNPVNGKVEDACGDSVSISADGHRVAIGCDEKGFQEGQTDQFGISTNGYVKVFDYDDSLGQWVQILDPIMGSKDEYLGKRERIQLSGDGKLLFVSSPTRAQIFTEP